VRFCVGVSLFTPRSVAKGAVLLNIHPVRKDSDPPPGSVREATPADLPAVVAIYNESIPSRRATADLEPVTVEARREWFEAHVPGCRPLWVVEEAGRLVGWLSFETFYGRPAYDATAEVSVYVAADYQGRGIGAQLLSRAVEEAPGLGLATLMGFVFAHNEPSVILFERLGFARWGRLPRVARLDGVERDVLILGRRVAG
jgi:phosphinothricin acetyltransferase